MAQNNYNASNITVLEGLEPVRERPAMYIGSTDVRGLHHLVYEVVDNSIDEALAGVCDHIKVILENDGSCIIEDNGRGIPVDIMEEQDGKSALEIVMTVLHAGGKFDKNTYQVSGGLHGVGVSVVNALSENLDVEVYRDGYIHEMSFARGGLRKELTSRKNAAPDAFEKHGTRIRFKPDSLIFETISFDYDVLSHRMRELAFLNRGITIEISDKRNGYEDDQVFNYAGGVQEFVSYLVSGKELVHPDVIYFNTKDEESKTEVEVALQYSTAYSETMMTFVNSVNTREGGTHLEGFRSALTRAINKSAKDNNLLKGMSESLKGDDVREGLVTVIS